MDSIYLKLTFKGVALLATTVETDAHIVPLACKVDGSEDKAAWTAIFCLF